MAIVAFIAFVSAGAAVAWNAGALPSTHSGAFGYPAQIASVVALGAVLSAGAADRRKLKTGTAGADDDLEDLNSTEVSLEGSVSAAPMAPTGV
jgi:hypothetical protein